MKLYLSLLGLLFFPSWINAQALSAQVSAKGDVSCFGLANGFVTISASGGTGPYSFELDSNGMPQLNNTINFLNSGLHEVRVRDANGSFVDLNFEIFQPPKLELGVEEKQDAICYGENTGEITLNATGGTGNYQFAIGQNSFTSSPNFKSLFAGPYLFSVRDSNQCLDDSSIFISSALSINTILEEKREVSCQGEADGRIRLQSYGGRGAYQYSLDGSIFQETPIFSALEAGNYEVTTMDSAGCSTKFELTIEEPSPLRQQIFKSDVSCFGQGDGQIEFETIGGTPPYLYSIDDLDYRFANQFWNLEPGAYLAKTRDINGCEVQGDTIVIVEPQNLEVSVSTVDVLCKGGNTGEAELTIVGGTAPYKIAWNDDESLNSSTLGNLSSGSYYAIVEDQNGCNETAFINISEPDSGFALFIEEINSTFCGEDDGSIQLNSKFGSGELVYSWSHDPSIDGSLAEGLAAGNYRISAVDASGCESELRAEVEEGPRVIAFFQTFPELTRSFTASQVEINFLNGSRGATNYEWDFGDGKGFSTEANPLYTYDDPGEFVIQLVASDDLGLCRDTILKSVNIKADEWIEFPDAFSPNGDGINDRFLPLGSGVQSFEITFFDKWGRRVGASNSLLEGWDGLDFKGRSVYPGIYVYKVQVVFHSGFVLERADGVILLR